MRIYYIAKLAEKKDTAASNGLTYAVERFKGQALFGTITFKKSERSELAALAADLL